MPERSVNRPIRSAGSMTRRSRVMASNRRERRESRWGTSRMRKAELVGVAGVVDVSGRAMELPGIGRLPGMRGVMCEVLGALLATDGPSDGTC